MTTIPAPHPEMDLQTLQSRVYAEIASVAGMEGCYAFYTRGDNFPAFTNGMSTATHERLLSRLRNRFPVTTSAGIGTGTTPRAAVAKASTTLQRAGSAQDDSRCGVCRGTAASDSTRLDVAHFDVTDVTEEYTDEEDAYETYLSLSSADNTLASHLYRNHDSLAFFVGGDNIIAICRCLSTSTYRSILDRVNEISGLEFRVGVGRDTVVVEAGMEAKHALEVGREREQAVVTADGPIASE